MNTIFYQFPHHANMQNIAFRPIRPPHSSKFNRLSLNCRNYQIITAANCEYLWQIQQILTQITFLFKEPPNAAASVIYLFAFKQKSNLTCIITRIKCSLSNLNNSRGCDVGTMEWNWSEILAIFFPVVLAGLCVRGRNVSGYYCRCRRVIQRVMEADKRWWALITEPLSSSSSSEPPLLFLFLW